MAVFMSERPGGLIGYWVYSTELLEPRTFQQMLRHFTTLLQSIVRQPDSRLSTLAILSPEEIEQQEAEKLRRKRSQSKKAKATTPAAVSLSAGSEKPTQ